MRAADDFDAIAARMREIAAEEAASEEAATAEAKERAVSPDEALSATVESGILSVVEARVALARLAIGRCFGGIARGHG